MVCTVLPLLLTAHLLPRRHPLPSSTNHAFEQLLVNQDISPLQCLAEVVTFQESQQQLMLQQYQSSPSLSEIVMSDSPQN